MINRTTPGRGGAVLAGAGAVVALAAILFLRVYPTDLEVYMEYGHRVLAGRDDIYVPDPTRHLPFTYPPFAALCFAPAAWLPHPAQTALVHVLSTAALVRVAWLVADALVREELVAPGRRLAVALGVLALGLAGEPVLQTLSFGQVNLVLLWLVAEDLLGPRERWRGVGVGLAMGFKLTPGIFLLYLLVTRQWRAAAVAAGTGALTGLLGFVLLPRSSWDFWTRAMLDSRRVGGLAYSSNQSLNGALWRAVGEGGSQPVWAVACLLLVAGFGAGVWFAHRAGMRLGGVVLAALLGLAVSPVSWSHHWVWVVVIVPALVAYGARTASRWVPWAVAAGWVVACLAWVIWWGPNENDREYLQPWYVKLLTDSYLALAVLTLVALGLVARDRLRTRRGAEVTA